MSIVFNLYRNPLNNNRLDGAYPNGNGPAVGGGDVLAMSLSLTTAGRAGFYIDYSELATVGTHKFYVCRTHGTTGAVTVDYSTGGDAHTTVSGTLSWADGEANIKSFTVAVPSKDAGDHRMWALLSNPTGGLVLHNGVTHTRAFGVIDDGTIASDSDAVFYDSAATGGTGTQADPYDSIYTAIANVGAKRYIYGKGTTVVDGTHTDASFGSRTMNCLPVPATRANEAARVYVSNWPGFTWAVTGDGGVNNCGFFTTAGESYQTYRGIDFSALDNTDVTNGSNGTGIHYQYGASVGINCELCTFNDINGASGSNSSGFAPWGVDGFRMWRSTANNIQQNGVSTASLTNTAGMQTYEGTNGSVQRCKVTDSYHGVFHKKYATGTVSTSARFNIFEGTPVGAAYGQSGDGNPSHKYSIIQSNLFKNNSAQGVHLWTAIAGAGTPSDKYAISNNVFDTCAGSDNAAIHFRAAFNSQIYNNIMLDCRRVWADYQDGTSLSSPDVEYADYNIEFGTTLVGFFYMHEGTSYATASALFSATGFGENDATGDPLFTNKAANNYTLSTGSSGLGAGISGVDCGIYLAGIEVLGAA